MVATTHADAIAAAAAALNDKMMNFYQVQFDQKEKTNRMRSSFVIIFSVIYIAHSDIEKSNKCIFMIKFHHYKSFTIRFELHT